MVGFSEGPTPRNLQAEFADMNWLPRGEFGEQPIMSARNPPRAEAEKAVFLAAIALPAAQQAAFLDDTCAYDHALRERVEALVAAHSQEQVVDRSPVGPYDLPAGETLVDKLPCDIGRYRLVERIGDGAFGVVYRAEQTIPVTRDVAIKIVKPGMDTKEVIARFEAERQTLAQMDHPHIAKVLDAGATSEGRPYFVMEVVDGIPIAEYCDQHRLSVPDRLKLFETVCVAVQHAHQKGIVHRDLKPSNILVTQVENKAVPKIIDFGIAKAIASDSMDQSITTRFSTMVGTPLYMSPEQADGNGKDIDTRSDVYALGVLLYELLTGVTPFDENRLREAAYDELLHIIREEEPSRPSARIATLGTAAREIAESRRASAGTLGQLLRRDLDWIVMKALEKDRERRFETVIGLATDVRRFLKDETVQARPPSVTYQVRKFIKRNQVGITTSALVGLALVVGTAASLWQAVDANRARQLADHHAVSSLTSRRMAEANMWLAMEALDEVFLTTLGNDVVVEYASLQADEADIERNRKLLESVLGFYNRFAQQNDNNPNVKEATAKAYLKIGQIQSFMMKKDAAAVAFGRAATIFERLIADIDGGLENRFLLASCYGHFGTTEGYEKSIEILEHLVQTEPDNVEYESALAMAYRLSRQTVSAIAAFDSLIEKYPDNVDYYEGRALCYSGAELIHQMERLVKRFPREQAQARSLARRSYNFGRLRKLDGDVDEAEKYYRKASELYKKYDSDGGLGMMYLERGRLLKDQQRLGEADDSFRLGIKIFQHLTAGATTNPWDLRMLGDCHNELGNHADAISAYRRSNELQSIKAERFPTNRNQDMVRSIDEKLARLLCLQAEYDEAFARMLNAHELRMNLGTVNPGKGEFRAYWMNEIAREFSASENSTKTHINQAVEMAMLAINLAPSEAEYWNTLGMAYYRLGDFSNAIKTLTRSRESGPKDSDSSFFLAMSQWQLNQYEDALNTYGAAVGQMPENGLRDSRWVAIKAEATRLLEIAEDSIEFTADGSESPTAQ